MTKTNDLLKQAIRAKLRGIGSEKSEDEIITSALAEVSVFNIEVIRYDQAKRFLKDELKQADPAVFKGQKTLFLETDFDLPYVTANKKIIRFGNVTGADLMSDSQRRLKNVQRVNDAYQAFQSLAMPLAEYSFANNCTVEEAARELDMVEVEGKDFG